MSAEDRLSVVLCWHMHQPEYRDLRSGEFRLPWTYLHAIKDYVDMAAHLERVPAARAVINFAPVLLEQIDEIARQAREHVEGGPPPRDPLLAALTAESPPADEPGRRELIASCLKVNERRLVQRFPPFQRLVTMGRWMLENPGTSAYADDRFFGDLVTWYHLAWLGESVRKGDPRVGALERKGMHFDAGDRRVLMTVVAELLSGVIERYRRLADEGRIELSVTPYAHPIVPLLLDLGSAREAMPQVSLPNPLTYPGGRQRATWHLRQGIEVFERFFGRRPVGCWPSEGSVSDATVRLLERHGFLWAASGEQVLRNSLVRSFADKTDEIGCIHRPYRLAGSKLACFFRDDGLSDLIGFTYSDWHADDAVNNLIHHLTNIAAACADLAHSVVPIILDGENAWEYYPENGHYFLDALYRRLSEHPRIRLTTFSDYLSAHKVHTKLTHLVAGSWVYGTFSTWIGERDKNRGWEMLREAKQAYDKAARHLPVERREAATRQLAICEGSDWFWWFGDYNDPGSVRDFDQLYRAHLANLYQLLDLAPPAYLDEAFSFGGGSPEAGGTMRRGQEAG